MGSKHKAEQHVGYLLLMLPGQLSPGSLQCLSLRLSSTGLLFQPRCIIGTSLDTSALSCFCALIQCVPSVYNAVLALISSLLLLTILL